MLRMRCAIKVGQTDWRRNIEMASTTFVATVFVMRTFVVCLYSRLKPFAMHDRWHLQLARHLYWLFFKSTDPTKRGLVGIIYYIVVGYYQSVYCAPAVWRIIDIIMMGVSARLSWTLDSYKNRTKVATQMMLFQLLLPFTNVSNK